MSFPELDVLDESIRAMFATRTGRPVVIADAPSSGDMPYVVMDFVNSSSEEGGWGEPTSQRDFIYQMRSVASSAAKVRWMQQRLSSVATMWLNQVPGVVGYTEEQQANLQREQDKVYSVMTQFRVKARVQP